MGQPEAAIIHSMRTPRVVPPVTGGFRKLLPWEVDQLTKQGCSSPTWFLVEVDAKIDLQRLQNVHFEGRVRLGVFESCREIPGGLEFETGVYNARLKNVIVGNNALILNVRQGIRNFEIGEEAAVVDIGLLATQQTSRFGNGQMVRVLREDGEHSIPIFDALSSNLAELMVSAHEDKRRAEIMRFVSHYTESISSNRGLIARRATVAGCNHIQDARIGPAAELVGVSRVVNCSINSRQDSPTTVGTGVCLQDAIISSGSTVDGHASINQCFVGQNVQIDRNFSAQDSLIFANCDLMHGESCSALLGPFTVSHHKSTLLIATRTSFMNAGSGASQSNHAYKTGPVHQGSLERGCKVGSSSSLAWPARVGAFSTVLGRHSSGFDTRDFPFSYLVEQDGKSRLIPGLNLVRVGLWRDSMKWPDRDRRSFKQRLDLLHFDPFTPWTAEKMRRSRDVLTQLSQSGECATHTGVWIKLSDILRGRKLYDDAIKRCVYRMLVYRLLEDVEPDVILSEAQELDLASEHYDDWHDFGGMIARWSRVASCWNDIAKGDLSGVHHSLRNAYKSYREDSWKWCLRAWRTERRESQRALNIADLTLAVRQWRDLSIDNLNAIEDDAINDLMTSTCWSQKLSKLSDPVVRNQKNSTNSPIARELRRERGRIESTAENLLERLSR